MIIRNIGFFRSRHIFYNTFNSICSVNMPCSSRQVSKSTNSNPPPNSLYKRCLPPNLTALNSKTGKKFLLSSFSNNTAESFLLLIEQFRTQDEPSYCGLSSLVMILNAFGVDPYKVWKGPWRWYVEDMLDCCVSIDNVKKSGVSFDSLICLARCNGVIVDKVLRGDTVDFYTSFKTDLLSVLSSQKSVILLSYSRKLIGQTGDGHYSPVGAYDPESESVLILDVARFKYPPHWVPLKDIVCAMQSEQSNYEENYDALSSCANYISQNNGSNNYRGYVIFTKECEHI